MNDASPSSCRDQASVHMLHMAVMNPPRVQNPKPKFKPCLSPLFILCFISPVLMYLFFSFLKFRRRRRASLFVTCNWFFFAWMGRVTIQYLHKYIRMQSYLLIALSLDFTVFTRFAIRNGTYVQTYI